MRIIQWIKNLISPKSKSQYLFETAAYHESGHILMAYLSGYTVVEVKLLENEPGTGYTKFDYGDIRLNFLTASMQHYISDPTFYRDLAPNLKKESHLIAFKASGILMGGPVSEALFISGIDFEGNLRVEMSGPDLVSVTNIDAFLSQNTANHNSNYISETLRGTVLLFKKKEFWRAVEHLAKAILDSPEKRLEKEEIEESLRKSGFTEFISKF